MGRRQEFLERKDLKMPIYVAEIAGRATFAFEADGEGQANSYLSDKSFLSDLYMLQSGGRSVWNGKSEMQFRLALPNEAAIWEAGSDREAAAPSRVFLVPVVDPLRHDNDDDDDDHDHNHGD